MFIIVYKTTASSAESSTYQSKSDISKFEWRIGFHLLIFPQRKQPVINSTDNTASVIWQ